MNTSHQKYIYKPERQSIVFYFWDFAALATGLCLLILFHNRVMGIVIGMIMCLFGVFQFLSTWNVLRTHFLVTQDEIASVSTSGVMGFRWDQIKDVLSRERPSGIRPGRPDRLVIITDHGGRTLPLNTSVLSREDEKRLLEQIHQNVCCSVQKVVDGGMSFRIWKR